MVSNRSTRSESSAIKGKKNKKTTPRSKSKKSNKSSKPSNTSTSTPLFAFTSNCIDHEKLKKAVKEYKYISPPKTLFERVYLSKFWDMLAEMYPNWLAPNTITLVGYICFGFYNYFLFTVVIVISFFTYFLTVLKLLLLYNG